jgi:hypothetical protein
MAVVRRELEAHKRDTCPGTLVACDFSGVGCKAVVPRGTLADHTAVSSTIHLRLMVARLQDQANEARVMRERLTTAEKKIADMQQSAGEFARLKEQMAKVNERMGKMLPLDEVKAVVVPVAPQRSKVCLMPELRLCAGGILSGSLFFVGLRGGVVSVHGMGSLRRLAVVAALASNGRAAMRHRNPSPRWPMRERPRSSLSLKTTSRWRWPPRQQLGPLSRSDSCRRRASSCTSLRRWVSTPFG